MSADSDEPGARKRPRLQFDLSESQEAAAVRQETQPRIPSVDAASVPAGAALPPPAVLVSVAPEPPLGSMPQRDLEWVPEFTHQIFPKGRLDLAGAKLRISYRDPDLAWRGVYTSPTAVAGLDSLLDLVTPPGDEVIVANHSEEGAWAAFPSARLAPISPDWAPPGEPVSEYTLASGRRFVVSRWDLGGPAGGATEVMHRRMETLAVWLIETASRVDASDPRWIVFGLYERLPDGGAVGETPAVVAAAAGSRYSFIGYATAYRFTNPMRRERPDALRLAQVVILPSHQRSSHGGRLLDAVAAHAAAIDAFEVTVEAPCEGMSRLRDAHDAQRALAAVAGGALPSLSFAALLITRACTTTATTVTSPEAALAVPLPELSTEGALEIRRVLRITTAQAHRVHEILLLATLVGRHHQPAAAVPTPEAAPAEPVDQSSSRPAADPALLGSSAAPARADPLADEEVLRPFRLLVKV